MTWFGRTDSYLPWCDHGITLTKPRWKVAWAYHDSHCHYYNVVRTLIIQPVLLIIAQVVFRYFLRGMFWLNSSKITRKTFIKMDFPPKTSNLPKITKPCIIYVILKLLFKKKLLSGYQRKKLCAFMEYC